MWDRYWHDFGVHRLRLAALRVAVFGVLAVDLWINFITHAPRYGAGGVNATQFAFLDTLLPLPSVAVVSAGWLLAGFLAARAALGIAVKTSAVVVAILYCGIYLWNQADSYQHHYMLCLLLGILAAIPAQAWLTRPPEQPTSDGPPADVSRTSGDARHWAIRMIYVMLALLYFWTGVTKANPVWLSGDTLYQLTASPENRAMMQSISDALGLEGTQVYALTAWAVLLGELVAGLFFVWRKLWVVGLLIVPWFHVFVEVIGFEIELFSYYMIAIDVILLLPRRAYEALDVLWGRVLGALSRLKGPDGVGGRVGLGVVTAGVCAACAAWSPYLGVVGLVAGVAVFTVLAFVRPGGLPIWRAVGHLVAGALLATSAMTTDAPFDYYRLWAGDLKKRAVGTPELLPEAIANYRAANRVTDGPARHFSLGRLLLRQGDTAGALAEYAEGIRRHEAALAAAKTAVFQRPTDAERQYDLAERHAALASKYEDYAGALRQAGQGSEAMERARLQAAHYRDGVAALKAARALDRVNSRWGRIRRTLERAKP